MNTGVGCHFLLQGIFLTQGSNPHLLHWQVDSLPLSHLRSHQSYSISQFSTRDSWSLNSMACRGEKCSPGFLWIPKALCSHITCNASDFPRLPHICFPLHFNWLQNSVPSKFWQNKHNLSCKAFLSLAYFWRRWRRIYIFIILQIPWKFKYPLSFLFLSCLPTFLFPSLPEVKVWHS